jgi:hypothetical protein
LTNRKIWLDRDQAEGGYHRIATKSRSNPK